MLPQLVFAAALVVAFGFGSRWVLHEVARVEGQVSRLQNVLRRAGGSPVTQLKLDKATGIYLPAKS